jgi:Ser-tRNA(Ala) deacylase AlaX
MNNQEITKTQRTELMTELNDLVRKGELSGIPLIDKEIADVLKLKRRATRQELEKLEELKKVA